VYHADLHKHTFTTLYGARTGRGKEMAEVHGVARRSMSLIWAMISKSLSRGQTVIPASSAVAAMIRKGMEGSGASRGRLQPDQVVVLCTAEAERHSQSWSSPEVLIWRVAGNQARTSASSRATSKRRTNCRAIRGSSRSSPSTRASLSRGGAKPVVLRVPKWRNVSTGGSAHSVYRCW
jgi:hypothetical protein